MIVWVVAFYYLPFGIVSPCCMWPCDPVVFILIDSSSLKEGIKMISFFPNDVTVCSLLKDISHCHYLLFPRPLSFTLYFSHHQPVVHDLPFSRFCLLSSFISHGNLKKIILLFLFLWLSILLHIINFPMCVYFHIFSCTRQGNITSPSSLCWDINLRLWVMSHCLAAGCTTAKHNKLYFISHTHAFEHNYSTLETTIFTIKYSKTLHRSKTSFNSQ